MSYELRKTFGFEASHKLPHHGGKCAHLHGHSWRLTVCVTRSVLTPLGVSAGMAVDYGDLKRVVQPLIDRLDHTHLNSILDNPTSENLARWCYDQLTDGMNGIGVVLNWVGIGETCTTECRYHG